jgi:hypothetical protein
MGVTLLLLTISARTSSFLRRHSLIRNFDVFLLWYLLSVVGHIVEINLVNIRLVLRGLVFIASRRVMLVLEHQVLFRKYFSIWSRLANLVLGRVSVLSNRLVGHHLATLTAIIGLKAIDIHGIISS